MKRRFRATAIVVRPKKILFVIFCIVLVIFIVSNIKIKKTYHFDRAKGYLSATVAAIGYEDWKGKQIFGFLPQNFLAEGYVLLAYAEPLQQVNAQLPDIDRPSDYLVDKTPNPESFSYTQTIKSRGLQMQNQTSYIPDVESLVNENIDFLPTKKNNQPLVLIIHTHTSEGYAPSGRSSNENENVIAIGSIINKALNDKGIKSIHDKTVHDNPYSGSYERSSETVKRVIKENPSIKIVIDVHRDALIQNDQSAMRVIADVDGKTVAQCMLVIGTNEGGLEHPLWQENLKFALKLQSVMNNKYPGLARPLNLRKERFNQNLAPAAILLEAGASGNTLSESKLAAVLFSDSLITLLGK